MFGPTSQASADERAAEVASYLLDRALDAINALPLQHRASLIRRVIEAGESMVVAVGERRHCNA
jgi:hypothetical protein